MASSLREAEFVLAVLQNDKRVALVHVLVGLEADFADEALHAGVLRSDVLAHAGVVGVFHMPEMGELKHNIDNSRYQKQDNHSVVNVGTKFRLFYKAVL